MQCPALPHLTGLAAPVRRLAAATSSCPPSRPKMRCWPSVRRLLLLLACWYAVVSLCSQHVPSAALPATVLHSGCMPLVASDHHHAGRPASSPRPRPTERERVSAANVASTMIAMLVNNPLAEQLDLTSLRVLSCGGSPQSPAGVQGRRAGQAEWEAEWLLVA